MNAKIIATMLITLVHLVVMQLFLTVNTHVLVRVAVQMDVLAVEIQFARRTNIF